MLTDTTCKVYHEEVRRMFNVDDRVYYIQNDADEMPCIKEGLVIKQDNPEISHFFVTVADAEHPDWMIGRQFLKPDKLSHTIVGALTMLNKAIDDRIQQLRDSIEALVQYKEAQLKEA